MKMNKIIRTVKRKVKYRDYKNINTRMLAEGITIKKGQYFADTKEIELIIEFNEWFLRDCVNCYIRIKDNLNELMEKFKNTSDENIMLGSEFVSLIEEKTGFTGPWIRQEYCIIGDEFIFTDAKMRLDKGSITREQYDIIINARKKYFVI